MADLRRLLLTPCLLLGLASAQPSLPPVVAAPLDLKLLPYGTLQLASGVYYVPNYAGSGVSIYIQSPLPLRIATLEESLKLQGDFLHLGGSVPRNTAPAPASAPRPTPPAPLAFPSAEEVFGLTSAKTPSAPSPAAPPASTAALPRGVKVDFSQRGGVLNFRLSNNSRQALRYDLSQLEVRQGNVLVKASVTARDSRSGQASGVLAPSSMLLGTLQVNVPAGSPLQLRWQLQAEQQRYLLQYTFTPSPPR